MRLLKRPSALLPPHAVLEHVLGSLRTPDFPTDGVGLQQVTNLLHNVYRCQVCRLLAVVAKDIHFFSVHIL